MENEKIFTSYAILNQENILIGYIEKYPVKESNSWLIYNQEQKEIGGVINFSSKDIESINKIKSILKTSSELTFVNKDEYEESISKGCFFNKKNKKKLHLQPFGLSCSCHTNTSFLKNFYTILALYLYLQISICQLIFQIYDKKRLF